MEKQRTVYKDELVSRVADASGQAKEKTRAVINALFSEITSIMRANERVCIKDFGIFETRPRASCRVNGVYADQGFVVPERRVPFFKGSKPLKQLLRGARDE